MGICLPYFHGLARVHLNSVLIVCPTQCLLRAYRSQALCWGWVQCCPTSCSLGQEMEIRLPHSRSFLLSLPQDHYGEDSNLGRMHVSSGSGWPGVNLSAQCCFSTAVEPQVSYLATPLSVLKWKIPTTHAHFVFCFAVLSVTGCTFIHVFYSTFPIFYTKPIAAIESQGSEANLPGSKPQLCLSQAVWPLLRFPHLHIENVSGTCFWMLGGSNGRVKHLEPCLAHG